MAEKAAPLWLVPKDRPSKLPEVGRRRPFIGIAVNLVLIAAAIGLILGGPQSHWRPQGLFSVLLIAAMLSMAMPARFRPGVAFDPVLGLVLVAALLLGPLPAAVVALASEAVFATQFYRPGNFAISVTTNLASQLVTIAATVLLLDAIGFSPGARLEITTVVIAALIMMSVCAADVIIVGFSFWSWDGTPLRHAFILDVSNGIALDLLIAPAAALSAALYQEVGIVGLLPAMAAGSGPGLIRLLTKSTPIATMPAGDATVAYSLALSDFLELDSSRRSIIRAAAQHVAGTTPQLERLEDFEPVMQAALYAGERWDGESGGFPGVLSGEEIPIESRIVAVANEWASLTAKGTAELTPELALDQLRAKAGHEFDPKVVAAASKAVEQGLVPLTPRKRIALWQPPPRRLAQVP